MQEARSQGNPYNASGLIPNTSMFCFLLAAAEQRGYGLRPKSDAANDEPRRRALNLTHKKFMFKMGKKCTQNRQNEIKTIGNWGNTWLFLSFQGKSLTFFAFFLVKYSQKFPEIQNKLPD